MRRISCFVILLFLCLGITGVAQRYNFKTYGLKDGLSSLQILDMDIDYAGNLWLATLSGGVKFNGKNFTNVTNSNNSEDNLLASVNASNKQEVWFGSWKSNLFKLTFDTLKKIQFQEKAGSIMSILVNKQNTPYFYATKGIYTLTSDTNLKKIYPSNSKSLFPVKTYYYQNEYYVITKNREYLHFDKHHKLIKKIVLPSLCKSIFISNNTIYLGSFGQLFILKNDSLISKYQLKGLDSTQYIRAINKDAYNNLWFSVGDNALYCLPENFSITKAIRIGKENGLPEGLITDIIIKDNRLWIATDGNGLYTFGGLGLSYINYPDFLNERNVIGIKPYKNGVIFATDRTIYHFIPENNKLTELTHIHPSLFINAIEVLGDSILILSNNDAYIYYNNDIKSLSASGEAPFDVFYSAYKDTTTNAIYFGGNNTFNKIKNGKIITYKSKQFLDIRTLSKLSSSSFIKGGQFYWACLNIIEKDSVKTDFIIKTSKKSNEITIHSLALLPDNNILAGGQSNLYFIKTNNGKIDTVLKYPLNSIFKIPLINSLYVNNDTVYIVSPSSVLVFNYKKYLKSNKFNCSTLLTAQTGFIGSAIDNSIFIDKKGVIYVGTSEGLLIYNSNPKLSPQFSLPIIKIKEIKLFNNLINWTNYSDSVYQNMGYNPVFNYSENNLSFYFTTTSLSLMDNIKYRYRLLGYDSIWSKPTTSDYISYASLPPGNYILEAVSGNGKIWSKPMQYMFTVKPPFWQTSWFYVSMFMILSVSLYGFYYYRTKQLKLKIERQKLFAKTIVNEQEKERKRIAKDLHDSIGQQLLLIKNQTKNNQQLTEIVKNTIQEVRSISRNIHPVHLEKFGLRKTLEHIAETITSSTGIFVTTNLDFDDNQLTEMQQIAIYRMVQEMFNNIIKHAQATGVKLEAFTKNNQFILIIRDNGVGFKKQDKFESSKSLGLNSLLERASLINGILEIDSVPGKGTTITLKTQL
jgi:signal transduction histidine kinase